MSINYPLLIKHCHDQIRAGRSDLAVKEIRTLNKFKIPREYIYDMAGLCRRAGLIQLGIRLLRPILYDPTGHTKATAPEIAEYAILLFKNGSVAESVNLLKAVEEDTSTEIQLYKGFAAIMSWDYEAAIPHLNNYISITPPGFSKLVAKVNLASALIYCGELDEAKSLAEQNFSEAAQYNNQRLMANSKELLSQIYFKRGDFSEAHRQITNARDLLKDDESVDQLFIIKWQSIINSRLKKSCEPLEFAKKVAQARGHWETMRDLDFHQLEMNFDAELFSKLYCGTPHSAYRRRLLSRFSGEGITPLSCTLGSQVNPILNLQTCDLENGKLTAASAQIQNTLRALFKDVYRPQSVGGLFESIFQGDHFDPDSSTNRIRQLIDRTKKWLNENYLPIDIISIDGNYKALAGSNLSIRLHSGAECNSPSLKLKWQKLELMLFPSQVELTPQDVQVLLNTSEATAGRLISWAVESKNLERKAKGRYQINRSPA